MRRKFSTWITLSVWALMGTLSVHTASAQDFEVAPVKLMFDAEPGTSQTRMVSVKNHSSRRVAFSFVLADFLPTSEGALNTLPPNSTKRSCANWININPSFFELNPGDAINVQVSMLVPGEEFGSAWCMLYVQPTREQTSWSADKALRAGITVTGRIGIQIYQSPKSNKNYAVKVGSLVEVTSASDTARRFVATIENLGDKVVTCKTFLLASNMLTAEEYQFPAQKVVVFPRMSRKVTLFLPDTLPSGKYALAAIADYGPKYPLEGAQIMIDVLGKTPAVIRQEIPDSTRKSKETN